MHGLPFHELSESSSQTLTQEHGDTRDKCAKIVFLTYTFHFQLV